LNIEKVIQYIIIINTNQLIIIIIFLCYHISDKYFIKRVISCQWQC